MLNTEGITLVEILVAISIVAILSAGILFGIRDLRPAIELSGTTRDLITDIRYTQTFSVGEQIIHGTCLFSTEKKYQIIRYGAVEEVLQEKFLPSGISFQEINGFSGDCIKFNPYGSVKESGNIILTNTKSETKSIEIKPSGFSRIVE